MTDKENQIVAIANAMCYFCKEMTGEKECVRGKECYEGRLKEARSYYVQGIRKLPVGSVVISTEYQLPFEDSDSLQYWKSRCKEIGKVAYKQARKETAREFANAMLDIKPDFRILNGCNPSEFMRSVNLATDIIFQAVKEVAKRYGVEVEE